jgi:5,10-methylenetetrahydrofolate reductase
MVNSATRVKKPVDAFLVPERGNAIMRRSALGGAMVRQHQGLQTIMQSNCRDRNRSALQADLLAAYGAGSINIMGVSGEDSEPRRSPLGQSGRGPTETLIQ